MNQIYCTLPCTEEEYVQASSYAQELLKTGQVNTVKQAQKKSVDLIKSQRKAAKEEASQKVIDEKIKFYSDMHMSCDEKGNVENIPSNYIAALMTKNFKQIRLDEFSDTIYYGDDPLDDYLESIIANQLDNEFRLSSPIKFKNAINEVAVINKFNSLRDTLDSLVWDGEKRLANLFIDYLGAPDNKLIKVMAKLWCFAAVKRVYEPGSKFDNMIILQGPQGIGKSMFCERLAMKPHWYVENIPIGDKDALIQIRIAWIVNMDEITSLNKKDAATAKNFITASVDNYRSPFEKRSKEHKRHCVFIGTTNEDAFLKDSTAVTERRYWIVPCSGTRDDSFERFTKFNEYIVQQIWAEAVADYKSNPDYPLYIPAKLWTDFADSQIKYKSENDSELFDFLDDALNRKYVDFLDDNSLRNQYKMPGSLTGTQRLQDKFTLNSLKLLLKDNHIYDWRGCFKQYAEMRKDFQYGVIWSGTKSTRGLRRITNTEEPNTESNPNDIFQ